MYIDILYCIVIHNIYIYIYTYIYIYIYIHIYQFESHLMMCCIKQTNLHVPFY